MVPMEKPIFPLDELWDLLLSGDPAQVREAYASLGPNEQAAVLAHLERMATEEGWQDIQRASARTALEAIRNSEAR